MPNSPIFITGIYRSGSTLLTRILDSHPDLSVTYETIHFMRFCYGKYDPLVPDNIYKMVNEIYNRIKKRHGLYFDKEKVLKSIMQVDNQTYGTIYQSIMHEFLLSNSGAKRWGEKTLVAWRSIPHFLKMFPNAKVIVAIRDPRGVLCSFKEFTHEPAPNYLDSVFAYLDLMEAVSDYLIGLPRSSFFVFQFEKLLDNQKLYCKKICNFLEIDFKADMLNPNTFSDRHGNQWKGNSAFQPELKGISSSVKDTWKQKIDLEDLLIVETILGSYMEQFNYESVNRRFELKDLRNIFNKLSSSSLLQERLYRYLATGKGVEAYPSDPTNSSNWNKPTSGTNKNITPQAAGNTTQK